MGDGKLRRLRRLRRRLVREGLGETLRKAAGDHLFRSSGSVVMELDLIAARLGAVRPGPGITFTTLGTGDPLPPLCPFLAPRRNDFAAMLAAGKMGLFVLRQGIATGCAWIALTDHHDARVREFYPVAPGEAYGYSWLLDPAERARGTALLFVRWALCLLQNMGIRRVFSVIDRRNRTSYLIHQHFGYREAGMLVRHFHLFRVRWTRMSPYAGTLGLADPRPSRSYRRPA
ncbi:GNAT family N-acetyltransferase [Sphingomonas jeddahensis]|uniref:N-acetyltransferase domain-containing protein n=1 Tax=Sphingomonas jeddahensis TaxID=1915074 RepID=A0A1V2EUC6_9SPHN|nr:hypothetical protein [Sphingomonas jeddahensis]ONF96097.1 hypothetical protein SPHI_17120 [Sphingomonas jeddahensis]